MKGLPRTVDRLLSMDGVLDSYYFFTFKSDNDSYRHNARLRPKRSDFVLVVDAVA